MKQLVTMTLLSMQSLCTAPVCVCNEKKLVIANFDF